jgi:hypothetical protein
MVVIIYLIGEEQCLSLVLVLAGLESEAVFVVVVASPLLFATRRKK